MKKSLFFSIIVGAFAPLFVSAHAIGQVYNLPVPLQYYLLGAGGTVAVSFILIAIFLNQSASGTAYEKRLNANWLSPLVKFWQSFAVLVLLLALVAGLFGANDPFRNFVPLGFWIYFLIGMGVLHIFVGNLWEVLNPWRTIVDALGFQPEKRLTGFVSVALLYGLFWLELVAVIGYLPSVLGVVLASYTLLNIIGGFLYENWFQEIEVFSVLYGFIGKMSFFTISPDRRAALVAKPSDKINTASTWALLFFAIMLLAGTSFDSFKETRIWLGWISQFNALAYYKLFQSVVLFLFPLPFLAGYFLAIWLMQLITRGELGFSELAKRFSWSLIPIAFGYTLAHNFSLVIVSIPQFAATLSDPLGQGWNLFHTVQYTAQSLIISAKSVWFFEIGLVVLAHVIGVLFAHLIALKTFKTPGSAAKSQYPMVLLMVGYTIFTLWLLSLPLVIGG